MSTNQALTSMSQRVWYVEGGVHPSRMPKLLTLGKFSDDPTKSVGEETRISVPDPDNFGRDTQVGTMRGEEERATFSIAIRSTAQRSILQDWKNRRCSVDFFAVSGKCGNPQDFTEGGEKWVFFYDGKISSHSFENFGAFGLDENNPVNETVDLTADDYWEFLYLRQDKIGDNVTTREIYAIDVDAETDCDDCADAGKRVLMVMAGNSATPGTQPILLYSSDKGETFSQNTINQLFSNENVVGAEVIGGDYVILSNTANGLVWTKIDEVYEGVNQWNRVTSGFVTNKQPNAFSFANIRNAWVVGNGGYIYFMSNYKVGVEVQDAGVATTNHLRSVHALDTNNVLIVGDANTVVYSSNGGSTWESVIGPSVGVNLGTCWMWDQDTWFVGEGSGGTGKLWYTTNRGVTWVQKGLPALYDRIEKVVFVSKAEGYLSAHAGGQSYILRTITGGYEWVVLPSGKRGTPVSNSRLNDIAVTKRYENLVYAAGLAQNTTNGIALRMSN